MVKDDKQDIQVGLEGRVRDSANNNQRPDEGRLPDPPERVDTGLAYSIEQIVPRS